MKRASGRAALDLLDREFRILQRQHDRRPVAGIAIEPLGADPVVDRAAEGGGHVLVADELDGVEAVQNRMREAVAVHERGRGALGIGVGAVAAGRLVAPPVRPHGQWRLGRVGDRFKTGDAADANRLAPIVIHMPRQRANVRHVRVHVAVDGAFPVGGQACCSMSGPARPWRPIRPPPARESVNLIFHGWGAVASAGGDAGLFTLAFSCRGRVRFRLHAPRGVPLPGWRLHRAIFDRYGDWAAVAAEGRKVRMRPRGGRRRACRRSRTRRRREKPNKLNRRPCPPPAPAAT